MAELRTLVEREMDRAGSPSYSFVDLARRRERKHRNRRVLAGIVGLAVAGAAGLLLGRALSSGGPVPADVPTDPFVGTWELFAHGSHHTLEIRDSGDGTYELTLFDEGATVCDGLAATETSVGTLVSSTELTITSQVITCSDGTVLTDIPPGSFTYDLETDTLHDSTGVVWHRPGNDATVVAWQGMWPQTTREEAEKAQRRADAGDPDFTWQVGIDPANAEGDDVGAPIATRFVEEQLGWDRYRTVGGGGSGGTWDLVFIRCGPGRTNPLYPDDPEGSHCAPTIDETHYETVSVTIGQPIRTDRSGIWVVTRSAVLADSAEPIHDADWFSRQYEQAVPPTEAELLGFVGAFLEARVAGGGAESYLPPFPEFPLLYATSEGTPYARSEVARVEWGPQWPDGAFRVNVRLFAEDEVVVVEQSFTVWPDEGGRLRLEYYYGNTTENGAAVPERYGILGGQVTFEAAEPWFSPWTGGVVDGDESILVGVGEGAYFVVIGDPWVPVRPGCTGAPATTDELTRWIVASPELDTSAPGSLTMGGIEAVQIDVAKTAGAPACEDELDTQPGDKLGMPVVFAHGETSPDPHPWSVKHDERMRIYLLDLPGEPARSLAIMIIAPAADFEDVLAEATPIVDSFRFTAET